MIAELEKVKQVWPDVKSILSVPHTKKHYNLLVKMLDEILDEIGENEKHPDIPLLETIASLIESYEKDNVQIQDSDHVNVLKFIMRENNLNQKDLSFIGSQGVVSEILNGKRLLNTRQIKELSARFNISPASLI